MNIPLPLVQWTGRIGEPLYQCQPPTGYSDKADDWVNTGALLNRLNYSLTLASNRLRGDARGYRGAAGRRSDVAGSRRPCWTARSRCCSPDEVSPETRQTLEKQMNDPQIAASQPGRSGEAGERGDDCGTGAGRAGISAALKSDARKFAEQVEKQASEGSTMNISRRAFMKSGGVAMIGMSTVPAFLRRAVAATPTRTARSWWCCFSAARPTA